MEREPRNQAIEDAIYALRDLIATIPEDQEVPGYEWNSRYSYKARNFREHWVNYATDTLKAMIIRRYDDEEQKETHP